MTNLDYIRNGDPRTVARLLLEAGCCPMVDHCGYVYTANPAACCDCIAVWLNEEKKEE